VHFQHQEGFAPALTMPVVGLARADQNRTARYTMILNDLAAPEPQKLALTELEERIAGWLLRECPGVPEAVASGLRGEVFSLPYSRILRAIFNARAEGRAVTVRAIASELQQCEALQAIGGLDYLQAIAFAAPTVISEEDGRKQASETIRAWRRLKAPRGPGVELLRADLINPGQVEWVWKEWLAKGKFHLISGAPGTGKTTLALSFAAAITSGGRFPDGALAERGSVLMWSGEDGVEDSLLPRFLACGGDRTGMHFVHATRGADGAILPFDLACDMEALAAAASHIDDVRLLILDPVVSAVQGDGNKNGEVRRALQPLVEFAGASGAAVLGVTHFTKGTAGRDPLERVNGSIAFGALARMVLATARPERDGERRRLVRAKSNIGPSGGGFAYDLEQTRVPGHPNLFGQAVVWGETLEGSARELIGEVETPAEEDGSAVDRAIEWLVSFLGNGNGAAASAIKEAASVMGHSGASLRRAKIALRIESYKQGLHGGWAWRLPKMPSPAEGAGQNTVSTFE
jgi:putative DNA primase/helicase